MGQPRFPWQSNDVASCFPSEINNKTLKTFRTTSGSPPQKTNLRRVAASIAAASIPAASIVWLCDQ
jgi:hypothetical protein